MEWIKPDITAPEGFLAAGVACGLKRDHETHDLGILVCEIPAAVAGVFSRNKLCSATVVLSKQRARKGSARAVVVNSGNANACTGAGGARDAGRMTTLVARELGVPAEAVLVASTGVIGTRLPMKKVSAGIVSASAVLAKGRSASKDFTRAIMTTDAFRKECAVRLKIGQGDVTIAGVAKGAGMIAPNMATMLAFITTDAEITSPLLRKALKSAADATFNRITVDGQCSTNDTVLALASGLADSDQINPGTPAFTRFLEALHAVCERLAKLIVSDGEGATKMMEVVINGAATAADADRAARALADNLLLKCALHGADPNWGRIAYAVGSCGVKLDPAGLAIRIGGALVYSRGAPRNKAVSRAAEALSHKKVVIEVDLAVGSKCACIWGCDLSKKYLKINAEYHT